VFMCMFFFAFCTAGSCPGVCQLNTKSCSTRYQSGLCPGTSSIQCCIQNTPSCSGQCQDNNLACSGQYKSGLCPGSSNVQCCTSNSSSCGASTVKSFGGIPVFRISGETPFFWTGPLATDADGAPNAYNPDDTGIDYLANAGKPGNWWGIATDSKGTPYKQGVYPIGSYNPFPGFYVSTTSLVNPNFPAYDVRRYADATQIPFIVLPLSHGLGAKLGDFGFAYNKNTGKSAFVTYADNGPGNKIGEGSVALTIALGGNPWNAARTRVTNGIGSGISTLVFPGSGNGKLPTLAEINGKGNEALTKWGGFARFQSCVLGK